MIININVLLYQKLLFQKYLLWFNRSGGFVEELCQLEIIKNCRVYHKIRPLKVLLYLLYM